MNSIGNANVDIAAIRPATSVCPPEDLSGPWGDPFIHVRIEEQAQRSPVAVAVASQDRQLTYAQVNGMANDLAWKLIALGAGPDTRVGVLMGRSAALVVALVGILKAGAAYVPLDPDYPVDRLRFMLQDTQAQLLVTEKDLHQKLDMRFEGTVVGIEQFLQNRAGDHHANPPKPPHGDNLAYVTYTSGSTGRPKAVGVRHESAAKFVSWSGTVFRPEELAGVLFATSVCFDLSIFEIFVPLSVGGQVIVAANVLDLAVVTGNEQITLINTVPSLMAELLHLVSIPRSVRVINLAGEALSAALVRNIREQTGIDRIFNLYGPSECTTYSTFAALTKDDSYRDVTIGAAIDGTHCYVLNNVFEPVASGEEGELFIGGDGVARGYINRPALTAERFLPDPFAGRAGKRMYRTGDWVRQRPDGSLLYSGRADFQIKLRGYRIELGEIESVLEEDTAIDRAIVMLLGDATEDKRLVAFIVSKDRGNRLHRADLRARLRLKLPDYMIPGTWVELERFPMTLNGKVDRSALALLEHPQPRQMMEETLPRSATERSLASIWKELLAVETVGREDDFFVLGGHSLTASRMLVRIAQEHGVELSLKDLFSAPILKDFSAVVEAAARQEVVAVVPLQRLGSPQAPLSYSQETLYVEDQLYSPAVCYNVAESFRIAGPLNMPAFEWALAEVIRRHEALRTRFVWQGDEVVQRIDPPNSMPKLLVRDLTGLGEEQERQQEARRLQIENAREVFRLEAGGLLRAMLLQCGTDDYRLVITVHHIATDGWGQSVLRREIGDLYHSFGRSSPLPDLPIQYADYAVWQRSWLNETRLQEGLDYWTKQLDGVNANSGFVPNRSTKSSRFLRGAREQVRLDPALTSQLKQFCVQHGVTPFMLLLSVLKVLLYRTTGIEDIAVGTVFSDRRPLETELLIGNFTNTVVLRTDLSGNPKFCDLLRKVARSTLDAQQYRDIPYQKVVERAGAHLALNRQTFFQVMLVLENVTNESLQFGKDLTVTPERIDIGAAIASFVLSLVEDGDQLTGHVEYYLDLFNQETIRSLFASFKALLKAYIAHPDHTIDQFALLPEADRHQVMTSGSEALGILDGTRATARLEKSAKWRADDNTTATDTRSETEYRITEIFKEVLKRELVGRHDNFLELGGHSLSAIRVALRLSALFAIKLPARTLFDFPTPAGLAIVVEQHLAAGKLPNSSDSAVVAKSVGMEQMLATLDTLAEDEVELLLEQLNKKAAQ